MRNRILFQTIQAIPLSPVKLEGLQPTLYFSEKSGTLPKWFGKSCYSRVSLPQKHTMPSAILTYHLCSQRLSQLLSRYQRVKVTLLGYFSTTQDQISLTALRKHIRNSMTGICVAYLFCSHRWVAPRNSNNPVLGHTERCCFSFFT